MLINSNDTDIILVDNSGQIIYDDIGNGKCRRKEYKGFISRSSGKLSIDPIM